PCDAPIWLRNAGVTDCITLEQCRRFYAEEIQYAANLRSPALIEAFARVPRENFLGPGPWQIGAPDLATGKVDYLTTASSDPRHLYHNVTIALDPARNLCNGQPGSLAAWISALALQPGDRLYHLGCGVGYFTAIMAEAVGLSGRVVASEVDEGLAARARQNLVSYSNVEVQAADGAAFDPGMCDAIFINAGVTHPHPQWLDRLNEGGRMILPLTVPMGPMLGKGIMAKITRKNGGYAAQMVSFVAIYSCSSVRDAQLEPLLAKAMGTGALFKLKSVRRDVHEQTDTCIVHSQAMCLSSSEPSGA
ncbi:MAG: protein-L-isoaspartate O-methyltransferase family protein, partial [Terriglobales bacterium]